MRLLTAKGAKVVDRRAEKYLGISTLILMENAGRAVAEEALKALGSRKRLAVFCGKGNNGADGLVASRHLLTFGLKPDIYLAADVKGLKKEARLNLEILLRLGQRVVEVDQRNLMLVKKRISRYNLIIDALLGVGLKGQLSGIYKDLVEIINNAKGYVLAIDIPSGLDATSGRVLGCCVKADKTVTFVSKKKGMTQREGPYYCQKIVVRGLGVPLL